MDHVVIRKLKIEDAEDVTKIHGAITQSEVEIDFKRVTAEQERKEEDAGFVAEIQGKVVGFMISSVVSGGFGTENSAWITLFGVDPKFMGQGIGKKLADETFQFYKERGIKNIYTSVRWDSTDLLSFFKTLGFDRSDFINLRRPIE